ncbi:MAG: family 10 glycosylhydrolase [Phycisphaerae bacterium]|nr:family 10 glycosylhydrolase [Phycisphaerae bacterium]
MPTKHHRTRVISCAVTCCLIGGLIAPPAVAQSSMRAFWADAFHEGFRSTSQIDAMISMAMTGNYNAIIAEVLAYQDNVGSGHGAYWNSSIVPKAGDIVGGIDPLAYLVQQAHANGLEVHCWLVAYRVSTAWPPSGNTVVQPEWIMVPRSDMGGGPATVDGKYTLDPGSPEVQEYLVSIVRELVTNYEIDGIHWDYIRYTSTNAGYPADTGYDQSGLARFQDITGYVGTPPYSGEPSWDDFRRREIDELVRRVRAEIPSVTSNPRQPLRHTAALITWGDAPSNFESTSAYGIFQNWRYWMEQGYLDAGIPMCYYREYNPPHDQWYRNWVDAAIGWRYDRHMYIGPGIYLNSFADSVTQMQYARNAGADGLSTYSFASTNNTGQIAADWYPYVAANLFTSSIPTPDMPWRDPAVAGEGTLWGRVTDRFTGEPIDNATVQAGPGGPIQTDGNGYYVVTLIPASPAGTAYNVTASYPGYTDRTVVGVVLAGDVSRLDILLGDCRNDNDCDDGVFCNGAETCLFGTCQPGTAVDCDDGVGCTDDSCNADTDSCDNIPNNGLCDDGLYCNGAETCDAQLGCQSGDYPCASTHWCHEDGTECIAYGSGDFEPDGDVDLADFTALQQCFGEPATPECYPGNLTGDDGLIDLEDFAVFAGAMAGPS